MCDEQELKRLKAIRDTAEYKHITNGLIVEIAAENLVDATDRQNESRKQLTQARQAVIDAEKVLGVF